MLTTLERKGLFTLTRAGALVVILGLFIGIGITTSDALKSRGNPVPTPVGTQELLAEVNGDSNRAQETQEVPSEGVTYDNLSGLRIPTFQSNLIQKYPKARQFFSDLLKDIPFEDRQPYLDEMDTAVGPLDAQYHLPLPKIVAAMTSFSHKREVRVATAKAAEAHNAEVRTQTLYRLGAGLTLIALFSLVLVLLAIERNTRK